VWTVSLMGYDRTRTRTESVYSHVIHASKSPLLFGDSDSLFWQPGRFGYQGAGQALEGIATWECHEKGHDISLSFLSLVWRKSLLTVVSGPAGLC
jgi:hypothetical protein